MLDSKLLILSHEPCVDAMLHTKQDALPLIAQSLGMELSEFARQTAVVDDGGLEFLTDAPWANEYVLMGAPANAKPHVKMALSKAPRGYVADAEWMNGFTSIYLRAMSKGARFVVTDRDGVLRRGDEEKGAWFKRNALPHFADTQDSRYWPGVIVLTGSSHSQNWPDFIQNYGFNDPALVARMGTPYLVHAENGAVQIDVLTGKTHEPLRERNPELVDTLLGPYQEAVLNRVNDEVMPLFGLDWTHQYEDQDGKVYVPEKLSMLTVNVPRSIDGTPWRKTEDAADYRSKVRDIMVATAQALKIPYKIL